MTASASSWRPVDEGKKPGNCVGSSETAQKEMMTRVDRGKRDRRSLPGIFHLQGACRRNRPSI